MNNPDSRQLPTFEEQVGWWDSWNIKHRSGMLTNLSLDCIKRGECVLDICNSLALKQPQICEIGCGTGWLCEKLITIGSVTGVDLSPQAIEAARQRVPNADFVVGDFLTLVFAHERFDVMICMETLCYVAEQSTFIGKAASLISPGGYLIITSVNKFVFDRRDDIGPPGPGQIRKWLSKRELKRLLKPYFEILIFKTVYPAGNKGILRLVNSYKINRVLECFVSRKKIEEIKEIMGLGQSIVIVARKR